MEATCAVLVSATVDLHYPFDDVVDWLPDIVE
jgi:hypothetical protein